MTQGNTELAKKLNRIAYVLSAVVLLIVAGMREIHFDTSIDFSFLPPFHSAMNALTAVFLIIALVMVKNGNIKGHQKMMTLAMVTSAVFLLSYVLYHITTPETRYGGEGAIRTIYLILLITHIVLAAFSLPFIMFTFIRGFTGQVDRHRKMAKWVYPIWLYVAITGPICYLMLRPYYG